MTLKIFEGIDEDIVAQIVANAETRTYEPMVDIVKEGDASNGEGYILSSGTVAVMMSGKKIKELHAGEIFGEIALLNEEERTASILTLTEVEVIVLSFENILSLIQSDENTINKQIIERIEENIKIKNS